MKSILSITGIAVAGAMVAGAASADTIVGTFHVATDDNTFLVGNESADIRADTAWTTGAGVVEGEQGYNPWTVFLPTLVTRISGLNPGDVYEVGFVYSSPSFFVEVDLAAGFTEGSLTDVPAVNPEALTDLSNSEAITSVYDMALGQATVDGAGNITVFVDDAAGSTRSAGQWAYNGLTLQQVPEPGSLALLGLGGLALLRRRR